MTDSIAGAPAGAGTVGVARNMGSTVPFEEDFGARRSQSTTLTARTAAGVYRARLEKRGYRPWTVGDVRVGSHDCARVVRTAHREARLQPLR